MFVFGSLLLFCCVFWWLGCVWQGAGLDTVRLLLLLKRKGKETYVNCDAGSASDLKVDNFTGIMFTRCVHFELKQVGQKTRTVSNTFVRF